MGGEGGPSLAVLPRWLWLQGRRWHVCKVRERNHVCMHVCMYVCMCLGHREKCVDVWGRDMGQGQRQWATGGCEC